MEFIVPIVDGYGQKSRGFQTITREPKIRNFMFVGANCIVLMRLIVEKRPNDPVPHRIIFFWSKVFFLRTGKPKYLNLYS